MSVNDAIMTIIGLWLAVEEIIMCHNTQLHQLQQFCPERLPSVFTHCNRVSINVITIFYIMYTFQNHQKQTGIKRQPITLY